MPTAPTYKHQFNYTVHFDCPFCGEQSAFWWEDRDIHYVCDMHEDPCPNCDRTLAIDIVIAGHETEL